MYDTFIYPLLHIWIPAFLVISSIHGTDQSDPLSRSWWWIDVAVKIVLCKMLSFSVVCFNIYPNLLNIFRHYIVSIYIGHIYWVQIPNISANWWLSGEVGTGWVMGMKDCTCCRALLNHYVVHLKLISHCMLTNCNLNKNLKK